VKKLNVAILVTFLIVIFASVGVASAATTTISASGQAFWGSTPSLGAIVNVTVNFQSSTNSELYLYRIGIHADWQAAGYYYSKDLSADPQIVEANGLYSVTVPISIPANTTVGQHTLVISADGYDSDGNVFNWDSASQTFTVEANAPTASPTSNQNGNSNTPSPGLNDTIIIVAVVAVVAVVVVLLLVIVMKRKRDSVAAPASEAPQPVSSPPPQSQPPEQEQPQSPRPQEKPEGKDFDI
jgi:flagellar basal body-associated protein FliL